MKHLILAPFSSPKLTIGLICGLFVATTACEPLSCTAAGCDVPVRVSYDAELPAGDYVMKLSLDGEESACEFTVEDSGLDYSDCGSLIPFQDTLEITDEAASIVLTLEHLASGEEVSQSYDPEYAVSYPNGKQCGPTCRSASLSLQNQQFVETILADSVDGAGGAGGTPTP